MMRQFQRNVFVGCVFFLAALNAQAQAPGPFVLVSPADNALLLVGEGETDIVNFVWTSSANAMVYAALVDEEGGDFSSPMVQVPANNFTDTVFSVQSGMLDDLLAQGGAKQGDTVTILWTVRAYNLFDSTMATAPHLLRVVRKAPLSSFVLAAPANNTHITTRAGDNTPVYFRWTSSTNATSYTMLMDTEATFSGNVLLEEGSDNNAQDTVFTRTQGELDAMLYLWGLQPGDSVQVYWSARAANAASETKKATTPHTIVFKREVPAQPPSPFILVSPANQVAVTVGAGETHIVLFSWSTSSGADNYTFMIDQDGGDFSAPLLRRASANSGTATLLTISSGELDALLDQMGVLPGDAALLSWTVRAYNIMDSTAANAAHSILLERRRPPGPFDLVSPATNTRIVTRPGDNTQTHFVWTSSANAQTYYFMFDTDGAFGNPWLAVSNNGGNDTLFTRTIAQLDALLASSGLQRGDSIEVYWSVRTGSRMAETARVVRMVRAPLPGPFQLASPANNSHVVVEPGSTAGFGFSWHPSKNARSYRVYFSHGGNAVAHRPANNHGQDTALTLTLGEIDDLMDRLGVAKGSDGYLQWTATAYTENFAGDTVRPASPWNLRAIRRAEPGTFSLVSPADTFVGMEPGQMQERLTFHWMTSDYALGYTIIMDTGTHFTDPFMAFASVDTTAQSATLGAIQSMLSAHNLGERDTVAFNWTVRSESISSDMRLANDVFKVTFVRPDTTLSLPANPLAAGIGLFPNPAQNTVMVELPNAQRTNLRILNAQGQVVAEHVLTQQLNTVDVSGFNTGLYFFQLQQQGGTAVKPVQVAR